MKVTIDTNTDFTLTEIKNILNKKFKTKQTGKPFTIMDIYTYTKRHKLPIAYGGNRISVIKIRDSFKLYRVKNLL